MAKPKSRITVSNRADGVTIRATGSYAINLIAALMGTSPTDALRSLQEPETNASAPSDTSTNDKGGQ